jgi:uncharacterized protein (DUF488 family)
MQLFTLGYEGADLSDFLSVLKQQRIDLLLDVRELPLSRRKGFSKNALREALEDHSIGYRHERNLGSPKTLRHRLYADGDYKTFFRDFAKHLKGQKDLLGTLAEELTGNVVLVCYEKDYRTCHRSAVATALAALTDAAPTHLEVTADEPARHATYSGLGQGFSPA